MKVILRTATAPNLDDDKVLDDLVRTEGWLTLMTFAREAARKFSSRSRAVPNSNLFQPNARPMHLHHRPRADTCRWTRTIYLRRCSTRSRGKAGPHLEEVVVLVQASAFAPTVRLRTRMEGPTAKFADCLYEGATAEIEKLSWISRRVVHTTHLYTTYPSPHARIQI